MDAIDAARVTWRWLWLATFPLRLFVVAIGAGFFVAGCLLLIPIGLVTLPVWLPVYLYFTEVWHADERARLAAAELATRNLLEDMQDPRKRQRLQWWG